MSFYICLTNFVIIERSAAELWRHIDFSRWRPYSRKCTSGYRFTDGISLRRWKSIRLLNFDEIPQSTAEIKLLPVSENGRRHFGIIFPVLGAYFPKTHRSNPQKDHPCAETRCLSHKAWKSVQRFDLGVGSRKKVRSGQDRTGQSKKVTRW